jgi:hypothetical protein
LGDLDLETLRLERVGEELSLHGVVFDDEDALGLLHGNLNGTLPRISLLITKTSVETGRARPRAV